PYTTLFRSQGPGDPRPARPSPGLQVLRSSSSLQAEPDLRPAGRRAGPLDPVRQGRAVQLDALPGEDLALPVKRKMIAVLGDQEMGEQGGGRQALGDRPLPEQEPDG